MINRKTIVYGILVIITIILIYNYAINPLLIQYSNNNNNNIGMHMGMNRNFYNNYSSNSEFIYFLAMIFLVAAVVLMLELIFLKDKRYKCSKCGYKIENVKWHKCPMCGNNLNEKRK